MRSFGKPSAGNHIQRQLAKYPISQRIQIVIHASNGQDAWYGLNGVPSLKVQRHPPQIRNWQHEEHPTSKTDDTNLQFEGRNDSYKTSSPRCDSTVIMMHDPLQAFNISVDQITRAFQWGRGEISPAISRFNSLNLTGFVKASKFENLENLSARRDDTQTWLALRL